MKLAHLMPVAGAVAQGRVRAVSSRVKINVNDKIDVKVKIKINVKIKSTSTSRSKSRSESKAKSKAKSTSKAADGGVRPTLAIKGHAKKKPAAGGSGFRTELLACYRLSLRRMAPARPTRPVPSRVNEPGSGTTMLVSPLEIVVEPVK